MSREAVPVAGRVLLAPSAPALAPLSRVLPALLFPYAGRNALELALGALDTLGATDVAVEIEPEQRERLEAAERPSAPSTGTRPRLLDVERPLASLASTAEELVLLLEGGVICRWPLRALLRRHRRRGAALSLLVGREQPGLSELGVLFDAQGRVRALARRPAEPRERRHWGAPLGAWLCAAEELPQPPSGERGVDTTAALLATVRRLLERDRPVVALSTRRLRHRPQTLEQYLAAAVRWSSAPRWPTPWRRRFVAAASRVDRGARIRRSAVESGAMLEGGVRLEGSVVLPAATIGEGSELRSSLIGPGVTLSPSTRLAGRLVTPLRAGRSPRGDDSVVGRLVYSPLGGSGGGR